MALPGVGKSTYCRERAYRGIGNGEGHWAPEPTDDLPELMSRGLSSETIQAVIHNRFIARDSGTQPAQWRDSDVWTSHLLFGPPCSAHAPAELWTPVVSDLLILLLTDPEVQAERIRSRARPDLWESELKFCEPHWQERLDWAYERHPAKTKMVARNWIP